MPIRYNPYNWEIRENKEEKIKYINDELKKVKNIYEIEYSERCGKIFVMIKGKE